MLGTGEGGDIDVSKRSMCALVHLLGGLYITKVLGILKDKKCQIQL